MADRGHLSEGLKCVEFAFENWQMKVKFQVSRNHPGEKLLEQVTKMSNISDPISDMLTRMRNAIKAGH